MKEKYKGKPAEQFYKDVERLGAGEPIDYVIGFTEFLGCKIDLSKRPLIPRPETEFWTKKAIEIMKSSNHNNTRSRAIMIAKNKIKILDVFAGSGCIGIAVFKKIKNCKVDFADKDKKCLEQIKINCRRAGMAQSKIIQSDIFRNIKNKYDYIFANPPYVAKNRINDVQKSVLKYESKQALFGGKDGLFYIRKFLKEAKNHLRPAGFGRSGGRIYMEFDPPQKKEIEKILKKFGYNNFQFKKDQYNKRRWLIAG